MYKISVPVSNSTLARCGRDAVAAEIEKTGAKRIFLSIDRYEADEESRIRVMRELEENCRYFKQKGYEVGAWLWTFWAHGKMPFTTLRTMAGEDIDGFYCPSDRRFVEFATGYVADVAKCGVDVVLFDDDFRYGYYGTTRDCPACLCDGHIKMIEKTLGESVTREKLYKLITSGGKNKYRSAYLKANGDAFRDFAKSMRRAVDKVNPAVRMGLCACMTSWDIDGTDLRELSTILAGKTQPIARLTGAPYWAVHKDFGNDLGDVIELSRMESSWTRGGGIEIMAEGDVFPRPRTKCPANLLEGFDTAIRASGCADGILKYVIDYYSSADYETGYVRMHERNKPVYEAIDRCFSDKKSVGVRVYESMRKVENSESVTAVNDAISMQEAFHSKAVRMLAHNAISATYEGEGVTGICFDESARDLPLEALKKGLIIDIAAAEILQKRGVDVGIESIGERLSAVTERFTSDGNVVRADDAVIYDLKLKPGAQVLSEGQNEERSGVMTYRYENADGNRFLVLCFNTRRQKEACFFSYARSRQLADCVRWLGGCKLPAYSFGNPHLYMQSKKGESGMAVGLWNFCVDPMLKPIVELDGEYDVIEFINCVGELKGDKVFLGEIAPYGLAAFTVAKKQK
ncbi:MAG: hypothetical protein ACI4SC_01935 [Candidatus Neoclostridium sp.]